MTFPPLKEAVTLGSLIEAKRPVGERVMLKWLHKCSGCGWMCWARSIVEAMAIHQRIRLACPKFDDNALLVATGIAS